MKRFVLTFNFQEDDPHFRVTRLEQYVAERLEALKNGEVDSYQLIGLFDTCDQATREAMKLYYEPGLMHNKFHPGNYERFSLHPQFDHGKPLDRNDLECPQGGIHFPTNVRAEEEGKMMVYSTWAVCNEKEVSPESRMRAQRACDFQNWEE
jgi:hypothetical protein